MKNEYLALCRFGKIQDELKKKNIFKLSMYYYTKLNIAYIYMKDRVTLLNIISICKDSKW